ncbi:MAG: hypothetical protein V1766_15980 [Pseudomonadota bacterium]
MRTRKRQYLLFIVVPTILLAFGCSTLPRDKGKKEFTRRMLVTAYDTGQKSTGWKHKYGCCLLPPVYAYGPQEGKPKKVGITSSGAKAKKGTIAADISRYPYGTKCMFPATGGGRYRISEATSKESISTFFSRISMMPTPGAESISTSRL